MIAQLFRLTIRGVTDFRLHPWAHLLTLVALSMVTMLAGAVLMGLFNINQELLKSRGEVEFQIYWKAGTAPETVVKQWDAVRAMEGLRDFQTFTPETALTELAEALGEVGDFSWLAKRNPLPYSALASFAVPPEKQTDGWATRLLRELKTLEGVERVNYTPLQADLAQSWTTMSKAIIWPIIGFLALVVALMVGNTIKLALMTRMDEVEILGLVGAKPWYVRWPLLTGGAVQGLMGAACGLGLLKVVQTALEDALNFPPLFITVDYIPFQMAMALMGGVVLVSFLASWVAVRR